MSNQEDLNISEKPMNSRWNWHPDLPIPTSPVFVWPPRPVAALKWLASYWLAISSIVLEFLLAWLVYALLQPALETMQTLEAGWIFNV